MKIRKVSLIVFYDKHKRILLQDRRDMSRWGEDWGFFGGAIENGETPEQALKREVKEELDFILSDHKFIGKFISKVPPDGMVEANIFVSPIEDKLKKFVQHEGQGMAFFSFNEVKKLKMVPGIDNTILTGLREYLGKNVVSGAK